MARIRTIKPEFQQSGSMGRVSREARLTFILLWPQCDDSGRVRGNSRMLASVLFPYDEDAPGLIDGWLGELENDGCIIRYDVDNEKYLAITSWSHQKIDHPSPSKLPAPPDRKQRKSKAKSREEIAKPREHSPEPRAVSSTVSVPVPERKERAGASAPFEDFWKACPKKVGRGAAEKAFVKAAKDTEPAMLTAAMVKFAIAQSGKDPTYIAHPATWLNQKRWLDEEPGGSIASPGSDQMALRLEAAQRAEEEHQRRKLEGADHVH